MYTYDGAFKIERTEVYHRPIGGIEIVGLIVYRWPICGIEMVGLKVLSSTGSGGVFLICIIIIYIV